jgi:molecular chaperone GrpE (heat shock protein)
LYSYFISDTEWTIFLIVDIEDLESNEPECHSSNVENSAKLGDQQTVVSNRVEGHLVTMATTQHEALLLRLQRSEEKARQCEENLQRALADMENIKWDSIYWLHC